MSSRSQVKVGPSSSSNGGAELSSALLRTRQPAPAPHDGGRPLCHRDLHARRATPVARRGRRALPSLREAGPPRDRLRLLPRLERLPPARAPDPLLASRQPRQASGLR